jgi:hypothetical protein
LKPNGTNFEQLEKHCWANHMEVGCSHHIRNEPTYKDKWGALNNDFQRIFDYMVRIGHNKEY